MEGGEQTGANCDLPDRTWDPQERTHTREKTWNIAASGAAMVWNAVCAGGTSTSEGIAMKSSVRTGLLTAVGLLFVTAGCGRNGQVGASPGDRNGGNGASAANAGGAAGSSAGSGGNRGGAGGGGGAATGQGGAGGTTAPPRPDAASEIGPSADGPPAGGNDGRPNDVGVPSDVRPSGDLAPNPMAGPAGPWARGVRVGLVEGAQGVFVKIGDGANVVATAMRNAPLIEGRPLFVRVHVATQAPFTARRLRAVLSLQYADNTKFEIEDAKMINGTSAPDNLATTFNLLVPATNVKPMMTMTAAIYETGEAMGEEPATPPRFPATGNVDLGIKAGRMELWVVVVPGSATLMDTPERRKRVEMDLYDLYPVQKVNLRVRAPVTIAGTFSSSKAFTALREARTADNAKPYEYYHLITAATGVSFAGVGQVPGATINDGIRRTAVTIVRNNAIDGLNNTVAHEIGHNHGRPHAPGCGAAGPDMMYPYRTPAGDMGVNGFSLSTMTYKPRTMFRELMSYCRPRWISDYQWSRFETRVRIVTGFAAMEGTAPMTQMLAAHSLQGYAGRGETPAWGVVSGQLVDPSVTVTPARYARLGLSDGRSVTVPVQVGELTDHETFEYAVNLDGADFGESDVVEAEVVVDGARWVAPVATLPR
jgi:hypothetical protein